MRWALLFAFAAACSGEPYDLRAGDTYPGHPFWAPVDLSDARDMGAPPRPTPPDQVVPPGPVELEDVTEAAGLGAAVGGGNYHGVGVAFTDLDGDGLPDIVIANGWSTVSGEHFPPFYFKNDGDGTFTDVTASSGLGDALAGRDLYSVAAADLDADGDVDLYFGAQPTDVLLENRGGTFTDVTAAAGAGGPPSNPDLVADGRSKVVAAGDYDGDGYLDLISASSTLPEPGAYLLRNRGDGTFEDVTAAAGVAASPVGNPCAVMWTDYDNDGDADLWIWNDRGSKVLLRNTGANRFDDVTFESVGTDVRHPMGIDGADIDHDLDLDYYVSNIGDNPLLQNSGDGVFVDITGEAGTGGDYGWGLGFEDFDNDSWADIFVAQEDNRPYLTFTNRGQEPPAFERRSFEHIPVVSSRMAHNTPAAFADYDGDGRVDVLVAGTDGRRVTLFRNVTDTGSQHWLEVRVARTPGTGERGGVGARIGVAAGGLVQFRDVTAGSSRASQSQLGVRFGLGDESGVEYVYALWPDGRHLALTNVAADQVVELSP